MIRRPSSGAMVYRFNHIRRCRTHRLALHAPV
jgi:hypothetical protein